MKSKDKDYVVHFLLSQMGAILLGKSPIKDQAQKDAEKHENRLRARFTKEELEPIQVMRDTMQKLANKMVNCTSVEDLQHTHAYIEELLEGRVMIAVENDATGEVTGYEPNR